MSDENEDGFLKTMRCPGCGVAITMAATTTVREWRSRGRLNRVVRQTCGRCQRLMHWLFRFQRPSDPQPSGSFLLVRALPTPSARARGGSPISDQEASEMTALLGESERDRWASLFGGPAAAGPAPVPPVEARPQRPRRAARRPSARAFAPTTPLLQATQSDDAWDVAQRLHEIDEAACDLCHAAALGLVGRVRDLLVADAAAVDAPGPMGQTALYYAAASKYLHAMQDERLEQVVDALCVHGADPTAKPVRFLATTPLEAALRQPGLRALRRMRFTPEQATQGLCAAIRDRNLPAADALAEAGAQLGSEPVRRLLPERVQQNHPAGVAWLLERGVDANATDPRGWTALHCAAYRGWPARHLQMLLDHGADVNARDPRGHTALRLALRRNKHTSVEFLRGVGAPE